MVYVLKGWVRFEYDGVGEVMLEPGSCVFQPPGILHREIAHSEDLELIEITSPAEFETVAVEAPLKACAVRPGGDAPARAVARANQRGDRIMIIWRPSSWGSSSTLAISLVSSLTFNSNFRPRF